MSIRFTGRLQTDPGCVTRGATIKNGTRVARSQSVCLCHAPFSPNCQPWSDQTTMTVLLWYELFSKASNRSPTIASAKLIEAKYAWTASLYFPSFFTSSKSACRASAIFLPATGTSSRSSLLTLGSLILSKGYKSKYFLGTYHGRCGR